jgi:hypothetical protein
VAGCSGGGGYWTARSSAAGVSSVQSESHLAGRWLVCSYAGDGGVAALPSVSVVSAVAGQPADVLESNAALREALEVRLTEEGPQKGKGHLRATGYCISERWSPIKHCD